MGEDFLTCLRTARKGAAPGPSGMTADHLFFILEGEADSELLVKVASKLAVGDVPDEVIDGIRVGLLTAFVKPDGGVRGIVVGDIIRRLVAKTSLPREPRRSLLRSSTPCRQRRVVSASHTPCRLSPTKTPTPRLPI